jgi:uncharacterized membrane protein YraQ (UPF0718 family)
MKKVLVKYRNLLAVLCIMGLVSLANVEFGKSVATITLSQLKTMVLVIPPIFLLLGLLDVWVSKETMSKYMGEGSGLKGTLLAMLIGAAATGPLYGAFPFVTVFMKKGVRFKNILVFLGAWSTTKIPMLLFEIASLGPKFALTRLLIDIPGIIIIAHLLALAIPRKEIEQLYKHAETL